MKNYVITPANTRFKIAGTGENFKGYKLPVNAIFGEVFTRYYYSTDAIGLTEKTVAKCDKIAFICDDFKPLYYARTYKKKVPVFKVWIHNGEKWIHTDTASNQRLYYLGEELGRIAVANGLIATQCVYNHLYPKDMQAICGERKNTINKQEKGSAYGYMCKTPDRTTTDYDCVGDPYAENRRLKK